jgi:hypothetical protein
MKGPCYPAAEALYHLLGGKEAGFTPMQIVHEGISHWYLRWNARGGVVYIDPTKEQFETPVPYKDGRGRGFLTREPSKRAQEILASVANLC